MSSPASNSGVIFIDVDNSDEIDVVESTNRATNSFPHPIWSDYFSKIGENRRSIGMFYAKCKLCLGRKTISCSYGSAGNLKRHVEVSMQF